MAGKQTKKKTSHRQSNATTTRQKSAAKKKTKKKSSAHAKATPRKGAQPVELAEKTTARRTAAKSIRRLEPLVTLGRIFDRIDSARLLQFRIPFARPDDLLVCEFIFDNLKLVNGRLVRRTPSSPSALVVEFPPQSFGEQAFLDATKPEVPNTPTEDGKKFQESSGKRPPQNVASNAEPLGPSPVNLPVARIRMAGRSRLAFAMPDDVADLPFTLEAVLDACRKWPMRLDVNAVPEPKSNLFLDNSSLDATLFNKNWLKEVTLSDEWSRATQSLIAATGNEAELAQPIARAAKRLAGRALESLSMEAPGGAELASAMNAELDMLARKFPQLREGPEREAALAALSLMTTQAVAASRTGEFSIGRIKDWPFLPVIFFPHKPSSTVTALELPYRLTTSPIPQSNWWHSTKPVVHNGRTELWHTRLTETRDGIGPDRGTKIRALWSPDYDLPDDKIIEIVNAAPPNPPKPFRMSMDALDRQMLVKLMAGFNELDVDGNTFVPRAARSTRLHLTALGALLDAEGNWNVLPAEVSLEQWRHLATLGRDYYVKVVYKGFLCPFGHAASLIKVTERKFEFLPNSQKRVAVLRQKFYIVVREHLRHYGSAGDTCTGLGFPFTEVEIITEATPNLRPPEECKLGDPGNAPNDKVYGPAGGKVPNRACFWPMIDATKNFSFLMSATDLSGGRVKFSMPLLFVGVEANQKDGAIKEIIDRYDKEPASPRRTAALGGVPVCYAPIKYGAGGDVEGDTRFPTHNKTFLASFKGGSKAKPRFCPATGTAELGISAIQRLLQQPGATVTVAYADKYISDGFGGANPGEVFLKTVQPFELAFGEKVKSDALGGLATPSMAIVGLSRIMGPVAAQSPPNPTPAQAETALSEVYNNNFNPADFFKGAKILGGIDLKDILGLLPKPLAGANVPKLLSKQLSDRVEARFDWQTAINDSDPKNLFVPNAGGQTVLKMHGVVSSPVNQPAATTFQAEASIVNFKVNLFGCIIIWFDALKFTSKSGSKPDVAVDLHPGTDAVTFSGPLEFVNKLREIIPSNGFSDPPSLNITPSGISAGYSLNIPSVAVGIFALEHVSLGAQFSLPFDAKPAEVRFNFCERQRPFSLTVSLLGGGGFFAICLGTEGVREIEAALEFGAALSINLGVASGSVEVKAGVYYHWKLTSVELAGYVRLHGELSVLGLISASLTFNLQLAYLKDKALHRSVVWGEASLEVEIEILFLSFSVTVKCRREFGGSDSDPKFVALIPDAPTWAEYCEAFAAEAA